MMKSMHAMGILIVFALTARVAFADDGDIEAGKRKAAACIACHGEGGNSVNPLWPNLAKQKKDYLLKQLQDFTEGRRTDPLMTAMSKTLSEQDKKDVAAYFSSL